MKINPLLAIDFYKTGHRRQYPEGTTEVYSNLTPRSAKLANLTGENYDAVVFFGLQFFMQDFLIDTWNEGFFKKNKYVVLCEYEDVMSKALGKGAISVSHIAALHNLGYLPIKIKALEEGTRVPIGVPVLTIVNTHPDFFWLTNYLETIMSCYLWKPITSATIAYQFKKLLTQYAVKTGIDLEFVKFQAHDFSFRGMSSPQDAALSGAAHLTSFVGTDTVLAIDLLNQYYLGNCCSGIVGCSVPATEHSVMCMGTQENEILTFTRLITEIYPKGVISIVSDTWDFWEVVSLFMVLLKDTILARDGKVVLRPDSGDPVKIICGDPDAPKDSPQFKGAVICLWEIFGGTLTSTGHKLLDSHIGLIYGDSITLDRAREILAGLEAKGFASGNIIFGVGSFTYQYTTRDTFGLAMKATSGVVNDKRRDIFKNPITDDGTKKSARGLLKVSHNFDTQKLVLLESQTENQEQQGYLEDVFVNGKILYKDSIEIIRRRLSNET